MQKEVQTLKDSNENHIFINEKLNKALKRSEQRIEQLQHKLKSANEESMLLKKSVVHVEAEPFGGEVSSIMITADMIDNFNIAE